MVEDKEYFSNQYVNATESTVSAKDNKSAKAEEMEIDSEKYGIAKPKRQIIRGKIIND